MGQEEREASEEEEEDDWDIEDEIEELREALSSVIVDREGNRDRRQGMLLGERGVGVLEVFRRGAAPYVPHEWVTIKIGEPSYAAIEAVGAGRVGSLSYDAALCLLLDASDGRSRSGLLEQVKRVAGVALCALLPEEQAVKQVRRASRASACPDLFLCVQQATVASSRACLQKEETAPREASESAAGEVGGPSGRVRQVLLNVESADLGAVYADQKRAWFAIG